MGFGLELREGEPPEVSVAPALTYRATDGTELAIDEHPPGTPRERALARGLLVHALGLLDAADQP